MNSKKLDVSKETKALLDLAHRLDMSPDNTLTDASVKPLYRIQEIQAISPLFNFIFSSNSLLARAAAQTIHLILQNTPYDQWKRIGIFHWRAPLAPYHTFSFSRSSSTSYMDAYKEHTFLHLEKALQHLDNLSLDISTMNSLYMTLTFNRNGYVREYALKKLLKQCDHTGIVTVLLFRANDSVPCIQDCAVDHLNKIINKKSIHCFLPTLSIVDDLVKRKICAADYDHTPWVNPMHDMINNYCWTDLAKMIQDQDYILARAALKFMRINTEEASCLVPMIKDIRDTFVRQQLLKRMASVLSNNDLYAALLEWIKDKSPVIRMSAIFILGDSFLGQASDILKQYLYDPSKRVRAAAQFYLNKTGVDLRKIYNDGLTTRKYNTLSILGLCEVGTAEDFQKIRAFARNTRLQIKRAYLQAVFLMTPDDLEERILQELPTDNYKILKIISDGVIQKKHAFDLKKLEPLFCFYKNSLTQILFLKIQLSRLPSWPDRMDLMTQKLSQNSHPLLSRYISNKIACFHLPYDYYTYTESTNKKIIKILETLEIIAKEPCYLQLSTRTQKYLKTYINKKSH